MAMQFDVALPAVRVSAGGLLAHDFRRGRDQLIVAADQILAFFPEQILRPEFQQLVIAKTGLAQRAGRGVNE